ncbi:MAG: transcriptional regulator with XRE-family HTH domain [Nitrospinales bacterium]|jgi:transcriptional regulator with XRE-family HTH domain
MEIEESGTAKYLGHRLRQWRKSVPLKGYQLANTIGLSQGSLSEIETCKSLPSADTIAKLYQHTNLNIIWLLTGKGPIRKPPQTPGEEPAGHEELEAYEDENLNDMIQKLIRTYYRGEAEKKAHLTGFLIGCDPGE